MQRAGAEQLVIRRTKPAVASSIACKLRRRRSRVKPVSRAAAVRGKACPQRRAGVRRIPVEIRVVVERPGMGRPIHAIVQDRIKLLTRLIATAASARKRTIVAQRHQVVLKRDSVKLAGSTGSEKVRRAEGI